MTPLLPPPIKALFSAEDEALIEACIVKAKANKPMTDLEKNVALCTSYASGCFMGRLQAKYPRKPPVVDGEHVIRIIMPRTAFDRIVVREAMQQYCNQLGRGVALQKMAPDLSHPDHGRSPDVIFADYTPPKHLPA